MKIRLKKPNANIVDFIRHCGYSYRGRQGNELIFIRRVGVSEYPHFHIYLREESEETILSLHFDQKKPSYKGSLKHSAEYVGEILEKEMRRVKKVLSL